MTASDRSRRIVLLTEGHSEPAAGKTASCLLRYRTPEIAAILDSTQAGRTAHDLFGVGGSIPVVNDFATLLGAPVLLVGFGLPGENAHAPDEWISQANFRVGMRAIAQLWDELG